MNGFLDALERELVAAHPRRGRARRRAIAGRAAMAVVLLAVVGLAGVFVVTVGQERPGGSASQTPAEQPGPAPTELPATAPTGPAEPIPAIPPDTVAVLAGTDRQGVATGVARAVRARYDVGFVGASARRDATRTVVYFEPRFSRAAEVIAQDLAASLTAMDDTAREASRGADIAVEIGRDIRSAGAAVLVRPRDGAALGDVGTLRYARRTLVTLNVQLPRGDRYVAWTRARAGARPSFLGFLPQVRSNRRVVVPFTIPRAVRGETLLITRERSPRRPRSPGPLVVSARLPT